MKGGQPADMHAIFISYRREDAEGQAGRLFDDLVRQFGEDSVFMDVAGIEPGRDFRQAIEDQVASCSILLAVIGKGWLDARDESGARRLDDQMDFVRLEIVSALRRGIPVVPVLVRSASMPRADQLPPDLAALAYRRAVELTHTRWDSDVQVLVKALRPQVELVQGESGSVKIPPAAVAPAAASQSARRPWGLIVAMSAGFVAAAGSYVAYENMVGTSELVGVAEAGKSGADQSQKPGPQTPANPKEQVEPENASAGTSAGAATSDPKRGEASRGLEIVNVSLTSEKRARSHSHVVIDIQLRNRGDEVAFVTEAVLRLERLGELRPLHAEQMAELTKIEATHNYEVTVSPRCIPYTRTVGVSQSIRPNDVDRFLLTLSTLDSLDPTEKVYLARLELVYNEDRRRVRGRDLLMILPERPDTFGYRPSTQSPYERGQMVVSAINRKTAAQLLGTGGLMTPYLTRVLNEVRSAPIDESITADEMKQELEPRVTDQVKELTDSGSDRNPCSER